MKKIAIQGTLGSYHDIAAHKYFEGEEIELICCANFEDVFTSIRKDSQVIGMLAIENTIAGSLLHNNELLRQSGTQIIGRYKSAIVALKNALKLYPTSSHREEIMYLIVKSGSKLADNSVQDKQADRYLSTLDSYYSFVAEFPESHYLKELDRLAQNAKDFLDRNNKEKQ